MPTIPRQLTRVAHLRDWDHASFQDGLPHLVRWDPELGQYVGIPLDLSALLQLLIKEIPAGTIDGSNRIFTLARTPQLLLLYKNGLLLGEGLGNDYRLDGSQISFEDELGIPQPGDILAAIYRSEQ